MELFRISTIAFTFFGYPVSYIELIGTLFGFVSVYLAARANILTWPTGIINEIFLLILFFQVQLYADMLLQMYFLIVTIYGWYYWKTNLNDEVVSTMTFKERSLLVILVIFSALGAGFIIRDIHLYLPNYFTIKAAYPFADSLVMVLSIAATFLLAKKKLESWILWLLANMISVLLFFKKAVYFLSLEYIIFLFLAFYGLYNWKRKLLS